jgi:hypothetical protein
MKKIVRSRFQSIIVCGIGFLMMILFTACAGVARTTGTNTGATTITDRVVSVNKAQQSTIHNVNGQQVTVSGLMIKRMTLQASRKHIPSNATEQCKRVYHEPERNARAK